MKRFIIKLLILLIVLIFIDQSIGAILQYCVLHSKGGITGRNNYILNHTNEDCLIFGSSKASHHYIPSVFKDSTGLTTYNCGQDGNGIYYAYPVITTILNRYSPNCIIYDVKPEFDLWEYQSDERYISSLKLFYGQSEIIDSIIYSIDPIMKIKFLAKSYLFNSQITTPIMGIIKSKPSGDNGFLPLNGTFDGDIKVMSSNYQYDNNKINLLEKLILKCSIGTQLIFAVSPSLYEEDIEIYMPIYKLCKKHNIPFLFYGDKDEFINKKKIFKDSPHLNEQGALLYSQIISRDINKIIHSISHH